VGSGPHFLSGISYYTHHLSEALGARADTAVILLRRLIPARWYPGRERVGTDLVRFDWSALDEVYDGVDWYWGPSLLPAIRLLHRRQPDLVILQWWTGAVLHTLLLLAVLARRQGAVVVIEFHEVQDIGELEVPLAGRYVRAVIPFLLRRADGFVVHSEFDRTALNDRYDLGGTPVQLIPHAVYDGYRADDPRGTPEPPSYPADEICHLLYFGVIRPFKGVEDLVTAFDLLDDDEVAGYHLTVVGETWEGWTRPGELIAASRHRDHITFVNHYVDDAAVREYFAAADVVVLPYHRSSSSGPLQIAMGSGKTVIVSAVGGLVEATEGYDAAIRIPAQDPAAIVAAIRAARSRTGDATASPPYTFADAADDHLAFFASCQRHGAPEPAVALTLGERVPIGVQEIELGTPLPSVTGVSSDGEPWVACVIVARLHGVPLGMFVAPLDDAGRLSAEALAELCEEE
jgi:glycosyltransferase involved in cell wall biosynthesis